MDFGLKAEQYRQQLVNLTNNSGLTIALAYYIAKDFFRDLQDSYKDSLKAEELEGNNEEVYSKTITAEELMQLSEKNDEQAG